MRYKLQLPKDKIIFKLAILIAIEVLLVVSSFGISTYIQSQSTTMGNTNQCNRKKQISDFQFSSHTGKS